MNKTTITFVLISLLTACSSVEKRFEDKPVREKIEEAKKHNPFPEMTFEKKNANKQNPINIIEGYYFGIEEIDISIEGGLDDEFDIKFKKRGVNNLLQDIEKGLGLPIIVDRTALFDATGIPKFYRAEAKRAMLQQAADKKNAKKIDPEEPFTISLDYTGTKRGFLDYFCFKVDCGWWVESGTIFISDLSKKTWSIPLLSGQQGVSSQLSNTTSSGSSGGSSSSDGSSISGTGGQSVSSQINLDVFKSIREGVKNMLSAKGTLNLSDSFGILTVKDRPDNIKAIDTYVKKVIEKMSIQVAFNVHILTIEKTNTDNRGIKWDLVNNALGDFGLDANIRSSISADNGHDLAVTVIDSVDDWTGSSAVVQSLSSQVNVIKENKYGGITINHTPLPIQVTRDAPFMTVSTSTTANSNGTLLQDFEVVKETIGISMSLLPVVVSDDEVLVHFNLTDSTLVDERTFDFGESGSTTVPVLDSRNFIQRVKLKSGQTLVLTGFSQNQDRNSTTSPIHHKAWLPFGSKSKVETNTDLVIIITPLILRDK